MLRSHSAPRVLITSSNLVFSSASLTSAELFLPTQRQRRGRWHQSTGWAKVADGRYEVITEREGRWYYLGTYAGVGEPRMIDPRAFISMGDKVKNAIYRETLNGADDRLSKSVGGMYGRGMLRALKIGLEYIGYNEKLADELARSVRDRPDRHAKRRAGRRSGTGVEGR
ncbi:hypothetical protein OE88DRAFT_1655475 [Heliocybe sulcata]|uniref:Uncharacterized protein n=1 Tax=Heliocybe sulcata TaxID=5364 RepID=A0A5C3N6P0_9AGAM|nr:hypothetical protein OE88DRAFT_1655475 [Heliocybe sulcata]